MAHSHWGSWGTAMFCPDNSWAAGFGLKVEFDQGSILDDSALNGVVLKCYDAAGNNVDGFNSVTSTVGGLGSWVSNIYCSGSNNFITGVRLRSEDVCHGLRTTDLIYCFEGLQKEKDQSLHTREGSG